MTEVEIRQLGEHPVLAFAGEELRSLIVKYGSARQSDRRRYMIGTWHDCGQQPTGADASAVWPWAAAGAEAYGDDAYVIIRRADAVILAGKSERSVLYAVYAYAREEWGLTWIYPGDEPVTASRDAAAAASGSTAAVIAEPLFSRRGFVYETLKDEPYLLTVVDWLAKNRINELFMTFMLWDHLQAALGPELIKRGIKLTLGGHSMKFFLPEFAGRKQLDYSDMDWQTKVIADIVDYCRTVPMLAAISLWPEDAAVSADAQASVPFLPVYIRFTEQLRAALRAAGLQVEVEHIAYNAGLSWEMLELTEAMNSSPELNTLFAYWGRDYSRQWSSNSRTEDARAYAALERWTEQAKRKNRQVCVFEYYSDHFMLSPLFPNLSERMHDDLKRFKALGIDAVTNLVVPDTKTGDTYSWKWAQGHNSYLFARLAWGDDREEALADYWQYAPEAERSFLRAAMERIGSRLSKATAFNIPLFPSRVVDVRQIADQPVQAAEIVGLLHELRLDANDVSDYLKLKSGKGIAPFDMYIKHICRLAEHLEAEWVKKTDFEKA